MDKMELSIGEQLYQALAGMVAGGVLGVLYDIFRQLRMHMSRFWGGVTDAVYALLAGTGLFILGQGPGGGECAYFCCRRRPAAEPIRFVAEPSDSQGLGRRRPPFSAGVWAVWPVFGQREKTAEKRISFPQKSLCKRGNFIYNNKKESMFGAGGKRAGGRAQHHGAAEDGKAHTAAAGGSSLGTDPVCLCRPGFCAQEVAGAQAHLEELEASVRALEETNDQLRYDIAPCRG